MGKKVLAAVLCVALVLGSIPFVLGSASGSPYYVGKGEYVFSLSADENTAENYKSLGFGTKASDGRIWTDKSVDISGTGFDVTLSALAQEYVSTASTSGSTSTAADAVFVLDFTTSMLNSFDSTTRIQALVDAFNVAADIITNANSNNRIQVYAFYGSGNCVEVMPLGHYTNPTYSGSDRTDKYISNSSTSGSSSGGSGGKTAGGNTGSSKNVSVKTVSGLMKDGTAVTSATYGNTSGTTGTGAQYGIAGGVNGLIDSIESDVGSIERKPYVIFMTDGAATTASESWYDEKPSGSLSGSSTSGSADVAAATILTASYWKDNLQTAYDEYNTNNGNDVNSVEWFNIGLSISDGTVNNISTMLKPTLLKGVTPSSSGDADAKVLYYLKDYAADYSAKNYYADDNYVYLTSDYCFFCDTQTLLDNAFTKLASIIEEASAAISYPIVASEIGGMTEGMVFTDVLGDGMSIDGITLCYNGGDSVTGTFDETTGVYTFEGFDTTASVTENDGVTVLTWNLPADEISMFTFADRKNTDSGNYTSAVPTTLTYHLSFDETENTIYTNAVDEKGNALTTVQYAIPGDNNYYFNVTTSTEGTDVIFEGSTLRTDIDEDTAKAENITGTDSDVAENTYTASGDGTSSSMCSVTATLGNNGKVVPFAKVSKTVDKTAAESGTDVTYTTTVESLTGDSFSFTASDKYATTDDNTEDKTETGSSDVPLEITNTVTGDFGDVIPGYTPVITKIGDETVHYDSDTEPAADSDLDVTIAATYDLTYSWSGDIPASAVKPSDETGLADGTAYTIDTTYTSGTHYFAETDAYGNETSYYTFSGWDKADGTINGEDVNASGTWTKVTVTPDKYSVSYDWTVPSGKTLPDSVKLPTDDTEYVNNQTYSADGTYTSSTSIDVKNSDGVVEGTWTFSGWTDSGTGTINGKNEKFTGEWTYTEAEKYTITYTFDGDVPSDVKVPDSQEGYEGTEVVKPDTPTTVTKTDDDGTIHTYTLTWDEIPDTIPSDDKTITGTWTETTTPAYHVTYDFGDTVPSDIIPSTYVLPSDSNPYYEGDKVETSTVTYDTIEVKDAYGNVITTYEFEGWTPSESTVTDKDITVTANWKKTDITLDTYKVTYEFTGDVPSGEKAPEDGNTYVNNQPYTVDTTYTKGQTVAVYDEYKNLTGTYTFSGWDTEDGTIPGADVNIKGSWTYEKADVATGKVTYTFTGTLPDGIIAPTDDTIYTKGQTYTVDSTFEKGDAINHYDSYGNIDGIYTFDGWVDPNVGVMDEDGVVITGNWSYKEVEVPEYTVSNLDTDPDNDVIVTNGDSIFVDPNGGDWTYGTSTYTKKTEITVNDDMVISTPTRDGWNFIKWVVSTDSDGKKVLTAEWEKVSASDDDDDDNDSGKTTGGNVIRVYSTPAASGGTNETFTSSISNPVTSSTVYRPEESTVTGRNNAKAENTENPDIPYTGSEINVPVVMAFILSCGVALVLALISKKKKKEE